METTLVYWDYITYSCSDARGGEFHMEGGGEEFV